MPAKLRERLQNRSTLTVFSALSSTLENNMSPLAEPTSFNLLNRPIFAVPALVRLESTL